MILPPVRRAVSSPAEVRAFLVESAGRGYGCVVLHPREYDLLDIALADGMIGSLGGLRVMREPFAVERWAVALPVDGGEVWL